MSWLNRVLAVPAIGIRFQPWFKTTADFTRALEKVFDEMQPAGGTTVQAKVAELEFSNDKGLAGRVTSQDLVLSFGYRAEMKQKPGAVPHLEYPTQVELYSNLLTQVEQLTASVCRALLPGKRQTSFIGIVAEAQLDRSAPPPGLARLVSHLGRPWELELEECRSTITAVLQRKDGEHTRCHHGVVFHPKDEGLITLKLDWQRVFDPTVPMSAEELIRAIAAARVAALEYFDRFAKGDLNYGE